ncbi:hypothetical protein SprV_0401581300 [Sparganum proliferum]
MMRSIQLDCCPSLTRVSTLTCWLDAHVNGNLLTHFGGVATSLEFSLSISEDTKPAVDEKFCHQNTAV